MLSNILDKISFWALCLVVTLLPLFFIPFSSFPVETSKLILLIPGLAVSLIFWAAARFSDGEIVFPKSNIIWAGLGLVFAFLLSAIFSSAREVSTFGVMLDIGTFWFMFVAFILMLVSSFVFKNKVKSKILLKGFLFSGVLVLFFQILHVLLPSIFSFGVLGSKMDNIFGAWNGFGLFAGLISVISLYLYEFAKVNKKEKIFLISSVGLSLVSIMFVNFYLVWIMLGLFSLLLFVYKISVSSRKEEGKEHKKVKFPGLTFGVVMISLLFFMLGGSVGGFLPSRLGVQTIEISPTLKSTTLVSVDAIKSNPLFGVGPNRFSEIWANYNGGVLNSTSIWNTNFSSGSGFIPSAFGQVGIVGTLALLAFIFFMLITGFKSLIEDIQDKKIEEYNVFFVASLFMFISSFFYTTGLVTILLMFATLGVFIGRYSNKKKKGELKIEFLDDPRKSFFSILVLVLIMITTAAMTFKFVEKLSSVYFLNKAYSASELDESGSHINRALSLHSNDVYLRAYSEIYLSRIAKLVAKDAELTEEERITLQNLITDAVKSAELAVEYNEKNYVNYQNLGSLHYSLGLFGKTDSFGEAADAYIKASEKNPFNPGLKLSIANSYLALKNNEEAKKYTEEALGLKPNYVEAWVVLSSIANEAGDKQDAIGYAENALFYSGGSETVANYLENLKGGSSSAVVNQSEDTEDGE